MNPKYKRRDGEDAYEYGLRLIEIKVEQKPSDLDWEDIVELTGLDCHRDSLRKAASVTQYSGYAVMKYFKGKTAKANPSDDPGVSDLDCKIAEKRKETKRFQDQRREFHKMVDRIARQENLEDRLVEAAQNLPKTVGILPFCVYPDASSGAEAVLVLSDWHFGMVTDNIWNRYNTAICAERVQKVTESAAERLRLHKCSRLRVVVLGDLIHGAIHTSARVASEELACDQIMQSAEILAQVIDYLSHVVPVVDVYTSYGNHARTVQSKQDSIHEDNLERIVPWWLKERLKDNLGVQIHNNFQDGIIWFQVLGYGFCATHGDLDNVKKSPTMLTTLIHKRYGQNIDYILLGDKHHHESFEQFGVKAMICGALCGTDDYAKDRRLYSDPEQVMLIVSKNTGVDAEYHLRCDKM